MNNELNIAIEASKESAKVLMHYFKKDIKIARKPDRSPVTIADKKSENKIVSLIKGQFPSHNFLGEEFSYKSTNSGCKWIIDPLDGTKNFVRGMPFFGNCIALEKDSKIVAGVINMPALNLLAYASAGNGSVINGRAVRVSDTRKIEESYVSFGNIENFFNSRYKKQFRDLIKKSDSHRGFGDTLGYLLLAQGSADIVLDFAKPWDVAAAKIIIEEAGGKITDFNGIDSIYSGHSIATNGKLHDLVVDIFKIKRGHNEKIH